MSRDRMSETGKRRAEQKFAVQHQLPINSVTNWEAALNVMAPTYNLLLQIGRQKVCWPNGEQVWLWQVLDPKNPSHIKWLAQLGRHLSVLIEKYSPGYRVGAADVQAFAQLIQAAISNFGRDFVD